MQRQREYIISYRQDDLLYELIVLPVDKAINADTKDSGELFECFQRRLCLAQLVVRISRAVDA